MLAEVLRKHLERVELEVERVTLLRDRLRSITSDGRTSSDELLATLSAMSPIERHAHLLRPRDKQRDVEARWRALGDRLRVCMAAGDAPDASERARAVASEARKLIEAFANGNAAILEDLAETAAFAWDGGHDQSAIARQAVAVVASGDRTFDAENPLGSEVHRFAGYPAGACPRTHCSMSLARIAPD